MHSIHVTVAITGEFPDDATRQAHLDQVVSQVSSQPGFVHGYWLAPRNGEGDAYAFFDTEEHARASAPQIGPHASGLAEIKDVDLCPVIASA
jgi:hypothetical protein